MEQGTGTPSFSTVSVTPAGEKTIKCGNCGYTGKPEKNRSLWAKILAWLCVVFAPVITILYFALTRAWRCPNCKSTFVGIQKNGVFVDQASGVMKYVVIILAAFVALAVVGVLASVVLVSLNSARAKSADAAVKANLASIRTLAEIQSTEQESYAGVCTNNSEITEALQAAGMASANNPNAFECNASGERWAAAAALTEGGHWCVDSSGDATTRSDMLGSNLACSEVVSLEASAPQEGSAINTATPSIAQSYVTPGDYSLTGRGGPQSAIYKGTVTITPRSGTKNAYDLTWRIASGQVQYGTALLQSDVLSVSYYEILSDGTIQDVGVVSYQIVNSSTLKGQWISVQGSTVGEETLTR